MTKRTLFTFLTLLVALTFSHAQENIKLSYPEGLYPTIDDFINKHPTEVKELTVKEIELANDSASIIERGYFSDAKTNKRIKKVFAISYNGDLYFSNWTILKNKSEDDKSLSPASSMNAFVLVTIYGPKYLYTEAGLINHWQSGLSAGVSSGVGGLVGGALGGAIEGSFPETTEFGTGVVWDIEAKEFNVFRNCPDFNVFLEEHNIEQIDCGNEPFDLERIREVVESVNN